jgi:hypothetical protein
MKFLLGKMKSNPGLNLGGQGGGGAPAAKPPAGLNLGLAGGLQAAKSMDKTGMDKKLKAIDEDMNR